MAEKTILVCDCCGNPAYTQRSIDVCREHAKVPIQVRLVHTSPTEAKLHFTEAKCLKCGEVFKGGQGAAAHAKASHNWTTGKKPIWEAVA